MEGMCSQGKQGPLHSPPKDKMKTSSPGKLDHLPKEQLELMTEPS